ncbi:hypothetical protein ACVW19_001771 [Streptomyces sp. TE5632]
MFRTRETPLLPETQGQGRRIKTVSRRVVQGDLRSPDAAGPETDALRKTVSSQRICVT